MFLLQTYLKPTSPSCNNLNELAFTLQITKFSHSRYLSGLWLRTMRARRWCGPFFSLLLSRCALIILGSTSVFSPTSEGVCAPPGKPQEIGTAHPPSPTAVSKQRTNIGSAESLGTNCWRGRKPHPGKQSRLWDPFMSTNRKTRSLLHTDKKGSWTWACRRLSGREITVALLEKSPILKISNMCMDQETLEPDLWMTF